MRWSRTIGGQDVAGGLFSPPVGGLKPADYGEPALERVSDAELHDAWRAGQGRDAAEGG
jgi:hypothetical protein